MKWFIALLLTGCVYHTGHGNVTQSINREFGVDSTITVPVNAASSPKDGK